MTLCKYTNALAEANKGVHSIYHVFVYHLRNSIV